MQNPIIDKEKDDANITERLLKALKLDGLVNGDSAVINHLERDLNGISNLIPVEKTKSGDVSKRSKTLEADEFLLLLEYTRQKEAFIKEEMLSGTVDAKPYAMRTSTGCDYCDYKTVCGFDTQLEGYAYHQLEKYGKEEVVEQMRNAVERMRNVVEQPRDAVKGELSNECNMD